MTAITAVHTSLLDRIHLRVTLFHMCFCDKLVIFGVSSLNIERVHLIVLLAMFTNLEMQIDTVFIVINSERRHFNA